MYVLDSHRGLGAGKALVHAAIECVRSRPGLEVIGLTVTEGNERARRLYRACGFEEFGAEPMAMLTSTGYKAKIHMWRRVRSEISAA